MLSNRVVSVFCCLVWSISACSLASDGFGDYFDGPGVLGVTLGKTSLEDLNKEFPGIMNAKYCVKIKSSNKDEIFVKFLSDPEMFGSDDTHYINEIEVLRQSGNANHSKCKNFGSLKLTSDLTALLSTNTNELIAAHELTVEKGAYVRSEHKVIPLAKDDPHYQYWHERANECFKEPPHEPFSDQYKTIKVYENDGKVVRVVILLMESIC